VHQILEKKTNLEIYVDHMFKETSNNKQYNTNARPEHVVIALFALLKASNNLTESVAASTLLKQREAKA